MNDSDAPVATEVATPAATPRRGTRRPNPEEAEAMRRALEDPNRPRGPLHLYTWEEAGRACKRTPGHIKSLVYKHRLPRVVAWRSRRGGRLRITLLTGDVVALLQKVTLLSPSRARRKQGASIVGEMIQRGMTSR